MDRTPFTDAEIREAEIAAAEARGRLAGLREALAIVDMWNATSCEHDEIQALIDKEEQK